MIDRNLIGLGVLLLIGAASRIWIGVPNLNAVLAVTVVAGMLSRNVWQSSVVPFSLLLITDLLVFGAYPTMPFVYGSFLLIGLASFYCKKNLAGQSSPLLVFTLASSLMFYFISNLGVFLMDSLYPFSIEGFAETYIMALPFLRTQILGDLTFTLVLSWMFLPLAFGFVNRRTVS